MMVRMLVVALWTATTVVEPPAPLDPIGKWTVHYADDHCVIERSYGNEARPVIMALLPSLLTEGVQVRFSEPDPTYVGRADPGTLTLHPSGREFDVKVSSFTLKDVPATDVLRADLIVVRRGKAGAPIMINTGGSDTAAAALEKCEDALLKSYGIDGAALRTLSRRPRPVGDGSEAQWFKVKDYPKPALQHFRSGRVLARAAIGAEGLVTDCKVVVSAGDPSLDEQTCAVLRQQGRYEPALDAASRAVPSARLVGVTWMPFGLR